jgi:hypothetical protein
VTLIRIRYSGGERVAGGECDAAARDEQRADLPDAIGALGCDPQRRGHIGANSGI